jgi:hypothetical protein
MFLLCGRHRIVVSAASGNFSQNTYLSCVPTVGGGAVVFVLAGLPPVESRLHIQMCGGLLGMNIAIADGATNEERGYAGRRATAGA